MRSLNTDSLSVGWIAQSGRGRGNHCARQSRGRQPWCAAFEPLTLIPARATSINPSM